jgi:ribosomal protein S18 acetylase RimI-like enzyme
MARLRVETNYGPAKREGYKRLREYNKEFTGKLDYKPMAFTLREGEKVVGILTGYTRWRWLLIDTVWVSDKVRGKGMGKKLIEKAESEARKRGARNAFLYSFSFQAPGFYRKLGYREFGRLKNFPKGHSCHWLTKAL